MNGSWKLHKYLYIIHVLSVDVRRLFMKTRQTTMDNKHDCLCIIPNTYNESGGIGILGLYLIPIMNYSIQDFIISKIENIKTTRLRF